MAVSHMWYNDTQYSTQDANGRQPEQDDYTFLALQRVAILCSTCTFDPNGKLKSFFIFLV
jgi:hypothetical protein